MAHTPADNSARGPQTGGGAAAALRRDIDEGRAGDKIAFPDHAAAPLGTDDEAAGTPPSAEAVEAVRREQTTRTPQGPTLQDDPRQEAPPAKLMMPGILLALVAIGLAAWWFVGQ